MKIHARVAFVLAIWILGFAPGAFAGLLYNYGQLATKDLDQMNAIVLQKIKESKQESGDKTIPLKEGVQAVFSRPDDDGTIEKVISPLKSALEDYDAWEITIKKLTTEAIGALHNPKAFQPVVQVTYQVFLENMVSQLKPRAGSDFEKNILTQIRDADIVLSRDALHERVKRTMTEAKSPSILAAQVLRDAEALKNKPAVAAPNPDTSGDSLGQKEPRATVPDSNDARGVIPTSPDGKTEKPKSP